MESKNCESEYCKCGKSNECNESLFENFITSDGYKYPIYIKSEIYKKIKLNVSSCEHVPIGFSDLDMMVRNFLPEKITKEELAEHIHEIGLFCSRSHDIFCYKKILAMCDRNLDVENAEKLGISRDILFDHLTLFDIKLMEREFMFDFLKYHFTYMNLEEYIGYISYNNPKMIEDQINNYLNDSILSHLKVSEQREFALMYYYFSEFQNYEICLYIIKNYPLRFAKSSVFWNGNVCTNLSLNSNLNLKSKILFPTIISPENIFFFMKLSVETNSVNSFYELCDQVLYFRLEMPDEFISYKIKNKDQRDLENIFSFEFSSFEDFSQKFALQFKEKDYKKDFGKAMFRKYDFAPYILPNYIEGELISVDDLFGSEMFYARNENYAKMESYFGRELNLLKKYQNHLVIDRKKRSLNLLFTKSHFDTDINKFCFTDFRYCSGSYL